MRSAKLLTELEDFHRQLDYNTRILLSIPTRGPYRDNTKILKGYDIEWSQLISEHYAEDILNQEQHFVLTFLLNES